MIIEQFQDKKSWCQILSQIGSHDFVHTYDFHQICKENGDGIPILYAAIDSDGKPVGCWPVLKREIPGTEYFDLTSVYGYGGPLFKKYTDINYILGLILKEMNDSGAVSLFSRMHPLFVEDIPDVGNRGSMLGEVVVIDVQNTTNVLSCYRGSHRREIINSRQLGLQVVQDIDFRDMDTFIRIYMNSMRDLMASEYYCFSKEYFESLREATDFSTMVLFAELQGEKVAASIFIVTGDVMQYYLSGTDRNYRKLSPSKAIIAEAHEIAVRLGLKWLVLGGGVRSSKDSLFKFKTGFSRNTKQFYIVKKIFRELLYDELCTFNKIDPQATKFFPAYRA